MYTNTRVPDSIMTNEDYAIRAKELGHGIISTMEHGWQGRYIEGYELAEKYGLKFVFGTEAYWVKDRYEKDDSNCHICIFARNENGRQAINDILSEANITGFYKRPRIDIPLIMSLPSEDVIITSACIAHWKYDDIDNIVEMFHQKFGKNYFLEVQYHNTESQRNLNQHILNLSESYNIPLIMGCDSHYIYPEQAQERSDFLYSKGIEYPDEEGWFMDYPDGEEAYKRFADQCVLSHEQIIEAMENTNVFLEVESYDNPCFTHDVKLPSLYPDKSQEEKDQHFEELIWRLWNEQKQEVPSEKWDRYEEEISAEINTVVACHMADYFLLDYEIVKKAKAMGGQLTPTGRGSAVSFFINKLLGFTKIDRISAKVRMYPDRFMSATRILKSKSLPDIDMNVASPEIFWQAQKEVMGEEHAYQMIAYGKMQPSAAWKMYAKSAGVDFETANEVSKQIQRWQKAVIHAEDEEKDKIDIKDYIAPEYQEIYEKSEKYRGIVASWSPHPCASLVYQGNIRKEIGLTYIKPQGSGEGMICAVMDGGWAGDYKFLKNDWLTVQVVKLIYKVYERLDMEIPSEQELLAMCASDEKTWDVYKKQCTLGINQVEQPGTSARAAVYAPHNISELCAFVAAIRPGFKSMYKTFESRKHFDYGIPSFDTLIQTEEMPNSFVLYQEMSMAALNFAGIPMDECYDVIKFISKKKEDKLKAYKDRFLDGFTEHLIEKEQRSWDAAREISMKVWQILEDSSRYSFNASHSYCVSMDSLYCAWAKAHYPLEFYECFLQILEEKNAKDRMTAVQQEAESYFGIEFPPFRFRQDNTHITACGDKAISTSLKSIKGFNRDIGEALYECGKEPWTYFVEVLLWLDRRRITTTKLNPLIKIGYFSEFGNIPTLLAVSDAFDFLKQGTAKQISKTKLEGNLIEPVIKEYCSDLKKDGTPGKSYTIQPEKAEELLCKVETYLKELQIPDASYKEKMDWQLDILGYIDLTTGKKEDLRKLFVLDIFPLKNKQSGAPWAYVVNTKSLATGKTARLTIPHEIYDENKISTKDIIYADDLYKNKKGYWYLTKYHEVK